MQTSEGSHLQKSNIVRYLAFACMGMLISGLSSCWSLYLASLQESLSCDQSMVSPAHMICIVFFGIGGIISGKLNIRLRFKTVSLLGCLLLLFGYLPLKWVRNPFAVWFFYGVFCGLGNGFLYNSIIGATVHFCSLRANTVTSLLMFEFGLAGTVLSPLISAQILRIGVHNVFLCIAVYVAIMLALLLFLGPCEAPKIHQVSQREEGLLDLPRTLGKPFLLYFIWVSVFYTVYQAFIGFATACALDIGATAMSASAVVSAFSICNALGRLTLPAVYSRAGYRKTIFGIGVSGCIACICMLCGLVFRNYPTMIAAAILFGYGYGAENLCNSCLVRDFYGDHNFPLHLSATSLATIPAGILSTLLMNTIHSRTDSFTPAFAILLLIAVTALLPALRIKKPG